MDEGPGPVKEIPLRYVALVIAGQSPAGSEVRDLENGLAFIQGNAEFGAHHPAPRLQCDSPPKSAVSGDILVSVRAPVGALNWCDREIGIGRGVAAIRVISGADSRFIYRCMEALRVDLQSRGTGSTFQAVTVDDLLDFRVPNRSLDEQQRIADFLDDRVARIDQIIAARKTQVASVKQDRAAYLQGEFTAAAVGHGTARLGYLLSNLEQGWSPQADATPAEGGRWGVMRAGSVNGGFFRAGDNKALPEGLEPRTEYEIHGGDILMSRASGSPELIGSVAVVPQDVRPKLLLPDKLYRLTLLPGWSADFVVGMLRAHENRERIRLGISGAEGMANNLPSGVIRGLRVPQLSLRAQGEVVGRLAARQQADRNFEAGTTRSIELLTEYKQSLITAAVTGEFDVTTASTRIPGEQA
nr:restriction endonuclease subunit S [Dermacoccus nishinomiyaensis]